MRIGTVCIHEYWCSVYLRVLEPAVLVVRILVRVFRKNFINVTSFPGTEPNLKDC